MNGISIIIPLYNKEKTIENCLDKIFAQSNDSFEVIVVNDGSTDSSVDKLRRYEDRITLVQQANHGPSSARNNGARIAKYDYLTFVDADDEITDRFVESHLSVRNKEPDVELSINSFKVFVNGKLTRTESLFTRYSNKIYNQEFFTIKELNHLFCTNIHSSGFCINKKLFFSVAGFDEELKCWEISDALMRFSLKANKIAIIDDFLSLVFEDENSLFRLENKNIEYKRKFCDNILNAIEEIPDSSKQRYFNEIQYLCCDYWRSFDFGGLLSLYTQTLALPSASKYFSLPYKVKLTAKLLILRDKYRNS